MKAKGRKYFERGEWSTSSNTAENQIRWVYKRCIQFYIIELIGDVSKLSFGRWLGSCQILLDCWENVR
jgi:hypothetical protein